MKKCEHYREMFLDRSRGLLGRAEHVELQQHLESCASCRKEMAGMQLVWEELGQLNVPQPSDAMALKFQFMLNDFRKTANRPDRRRDWKERLKHFWEVQYRMPLAYALLLVVVGLGAAFWITGKGTEKQELHALQTQVNELKQTMMLALLDNPLASERIKAVSYTSAIRHLDKSVIEALLETLNNDPNVNVRLSTLDALARLGNYPEVRSGLVQSITGQESPLVQSAIADVMLQLQEKRAVKSFQELLKQRGLDEDVRNKIKTTITKLI